MKEKRWYMESFFKRGWERRYMYKIQRSFICGLWGIVSIIFLKLLNFSPRYCTKLFFV